MSRSSTTPRRHSLVLVAGAAGATVVTKLPVFLLGGLASLIRHDLTLTESRVGLSAAGFFAVTALTSVPGGRLAERVGPRRQLYVAGTIAAMSMIGIALATDWWHLAVALAVGGIANGMSETATNLAIAVGIRGGRHGFAFGIKQSAAPMTTLLAGLAVPFLGLTVGWRWAFTAAAAFAVGVTSLLPFDDRTSSRQDSGRFARGSPAPALVVIAVGFGFGTAAATALATFLVESAVAAGISLSSAGLLLAASSVLGVASRLYAGWLADRRGAGHLRVVGLMLAIGTVGLVGLALGNPLATVVGALPAFAFGWGWTGLLNFAIARINPNRPASSTGVLLFGAATGAAAGPLIFGITVETMGFAFGWSVAAGGMLLGALLIEAGRRMILAELNR